MAIAALAATGTSFAVSKVHATASNQPQLQNVEGMKLGEKPAAKIGKGKPGSKNDQNFSKDLGEKAQAKAKEAIAEASGLAKAGKPVADLTHREAGLGNYKHFNVKPARPQGARAVGAHAA